jgi:predicted pyridoxine 5'-phosphate oxidase superfamily flavin-nucleotide-binding protein
MPCLGRSRDLSARLKHRGGNPGFVRVLDESHLEFPDYCGNNMFNTLGNILMNSSVGLLFVNFDQGSTIQLSGSASVQWNGKGLQSFAGAQRLIHFKVERVVETANATLLRWRLLDYSPFNP